MLISQIVRCLEFLSQWNTDCYMSPDSPVPVCNTTIVELCKLFLWYMIINIPFWSRSVFRLMSCTFKVGCTFQFSNVWIKTMAPFEVACLIPEHEKSNRYRNRHANLKNMIYYLFTRRSVPETDTKLHEELMVAWSFLCLLKLCVVQRGVFKWRCFHRSSSAHQMVNGLLPLYII